VSNPLSRTTSSVTWPKAYSGSTPPVSSSGITRSCVSGRRPWGSRTHPTASYQPHLLQRRQRRGQLRLHRFGVDQYRDP
jgi:hypothetical protein